MPFPSFFFAVKTCDAPSLPDNATLSSCSASFDYNSACVVTCVDGFAMSASGQSTVICGADENWIGELGECIGR